MPDASEGTGEEGILIRQAQEGSEDAFCRLIRSHQDSVRAYVFRYVRDRAIMDDLAQEAFLSAFRRLHSFRGDSSLRVWLLGIARFCVLKYLRDQRLRLSHHAALFESALAEWKAQEIERSEKVADPEAELSALRQCLQGLSPSSANVISDYYFRGRPLSEIARSFGKRESAMKMTVLRIRESLRECVRRKTASSEVAS